MKAIILARVSSTEQEDGFSLDAQVARLTDYCTRKNLTVFQIHKLVESSTRGDREEFWKVIEIIKNSKEAVHLVCELRKNIMQKKCMNLSSMRPA